MLPPEHPDRIHVAFDDHRLVANTGLILPRHHRGQRQRRRRRRRPHTPHSGRQNVRHPALSHHDHRRNSKLNVVTPYQPVI